MFVVRILAASGYIYPYNVEAKSKYAAIRIARGMHFDRINPYDLGRSEVEESVHEVYEESCIEEEEC